MEIEAETKNVGGQVCKICEEDVGLTVDGEAFVACGICAYPVCRLCYEYERKDGKKNCFQCKTRYKRHKGSPAIHGDGDEDCVSDDDGAAEPHYSETQNDKQNISKRNLSWRAGHGRGEDIGPPKYVKEGPQSHIPFLTNGTDVSGELSAASPGHQSMASAPPSDGVKSRLHSLSPL